jgi:hypothetical protein
MPPAAARNGKELKDPTHVLVADVARRDADVRKGALELVHVDAPVPPAVPQLEPPQQDLQLPLRRVAVPAAQYAGDAGVLCCVVLCCVVLCCVVPLGLEWGPGYVCWVPMSFGG